MFAALGRRTALHAARRTAQQQAKRRMGGGAAAAPEWTGIDKVVRGYFPKDEDSELIFFHVFFSPICVPMTEVVSMSLGR